MEIITVDESNLDQEHICCCLSDKKGESGVKNKKMWLREIFEEGLVFKKANVRGKAFIEYIPAEKAWCPIVAEDYLFINCLWVSGQYKGTGIGGILLDECIEDAKKKNKKGIAILSSKKKRPYLSDPKFLSYKGFKVCDTAYPYFELLYLPLTSNESVPSFKECAKLGEIKASEQAVIFYSYQCPYTEKYTHIIEETAKEKGISFALKRYESTEQAQNAAIAFTTYNLFVNGKFVTHEIVTQDRFIKLLEP